MSMKYSAIPALHIRTLSIQYGVSVLYKSTCKSIQPLQGATLHFPLYDRLMRGPYATDSRIKVPSRYGDPT